MSFVVPLDRETPRYVFADGLSLGAGDLGAMIAAPRGLQTVYQPIVRISGNAWTVHALECLTRPWNASAVFDATHLFAAARTFGCEAALDRACVSRALAAAHKWDIGANLYLNLDPRTLETDASFPEFLATAAAHAGIAPDRLTIEITEHRRDCSGESVEPAARATRALGIRMAFDDIGISACDQRAIVTCRPDVVKLDGQVCRAARLSSPVRREIGIIAELARRVGAAVIAEGVERAEDAAVMADLGIDLAQGHYFCPPLHAEHAGDAAAVVARRAVLAARPRTTSPGSIATVARRTDPRCA